MADDRGNKVGHVLYDPYGEVLTNTPPGNLIEHLFTGQILDTSTGLYYYTVHGHIINTLLDVIDLAHSVRNCLGDSDTLSCYMVPVSAVFLVAPFVSRGGAGDTAVKRLTFSPEFEAAMGIILPTGIK